MNSRLRLMPTNQSARERASAQWYSGRVSSPGRKLAKARRIEASSRAESHRRRIGPWYRQRSRISRAIISPSRSASVAITTSLQVRSNWLITFSWLATLGLTTSCQRTGMMGRSSSDQRL
ncbi:hypothetical protein D3C81_1964420 [compost metagenome]